MIVVDTGVIFAVADAADGDHDACDDLLAGHPGDLVVPTPVIVESSWLIEDRLGPAAEAAFLRSVTSGELTRVDLSDGDWDRVVELVETYADLGLGLVDASVIAVAERLGIITIATLNHRDFTVVRPPPLPGVRADPLIAGRPPLPGPPVPSFAAPKPPPCDTGAGALHRRDRPPPGCSLPETRVRAQTILPAAFVGPLRAVAPGSRWAFGPGL